MNSKGEKNKERIDLGLGAILAAAQPARDVEISIELGKPSEQAPSSPWTLGGSEAPVKSEFDILADERKWSEIVRRVESRLNDSNDIEAKLWWIRGHLGAFSMPVSFLAAPLDSLCKKIQPSELSPSMRVLLEETGLLTLGRLQEVGDKDQADSLRSVLETVGVRAPRGSRERQRTGTSSFRSLEFDLPASKASVALVGEAPQKMRGVSRRVGWTSVCAVIVAALFVLDQLFPHIRTPRLDTASEEFVVPPSGIEQSVTPLAPKNPGNRLGALFYSIEKEGAASPAPSVAPSVAQSGDTQSASATVQREPAVPNRPPEPRTKESVDTDGPVEGPEFRERMDRGRPERPERPMRSREEIQGGPPQAVLPGASQEGFEQHRTYKVLAKTSVLSAPSYGGRVIGQLERGDRVLVEGKLGRWLRLRSKKGRGGYVIAADVEEVPDLDIPLDR
jgi:hypothetical protein